MNKAFDITTDETEQAAVTLVAALADDPMIVWTLAGKEQYNKVAIPIIKTWVKYCVLYGKAFRTENFESIAIRKFSGDVEFSFWRGFRSGMLKSYKILGKTTFKRLMILDEALKKERKKNLKNKKAFYY